jgi:hypothetical protein
MKDKLGRIGKEALIAQSRLSPSLFEGTKKNHEIADQG